MNILLFSILGIKYLSFKSVYSFSIVSMKINSDTELKVSNEPGSKLMT